MPQNDKVSLLIIPYSLFIKKSSLSAIHSSDCFQHLLRATSTARREPCQESERTATIGHPPRSTPPPSTLPGSIATRKASTRRTTSGACSPSPCAASSIYGRFLPRIRDYPASASIPPCLIPQPVIANPPTHRRIFFRQKMRNNDFFVYICSPETPVSGIAYSERCRSGRSGRTRNAVYGQLYRGVESLSLRK